MAVSFFHKKRTGAPQLLVYRPLGRVNDLAQETRCKNLSSSPKERLIDRKLDLVGPLHCNPSRSSAEGSLQAAFPRINMSSDVMPGKNDSLDVCDVMADCVYAYSVCPSL